MLDIDDDIAEIESPEGEVTDAELLEILDCEQNTEEWRINRMGIPTASAFDKVVSRGRADRPSETRRKYMLTLLGERLTGVLAENFDSPYLDRGHRDEPEAANDYAFRERVQVETVGFMRRGRMGYSPDLVVTGARRAVEIKSKKPDLHLAVMLDNELPAEHKPQVQGGLLVSGYDAIDFVSYCKGLPLVVIRVERDEKYIDWLRGEIERFNEELDALEQTVINRYYRGRKAA